MDTIAWVDVPGLSSPIGVDIDGEILLDPSSIPNTITPADAETIVKPHGCYLRADDILSANPGHKLTIEDLIDKAFSAICVAIGKAA